MCCASQLTIYIEHPVPIEPPAEAIPPPPQPLKLTKKELKKLRTQRRQAREKEKQDLIRCSSAEAKLLTLLYPHPLSSGRETTCLLTIIKVGH